MKTLISDTSGYRVMAELREVQIPENLIQLRFLTQWDHAKNPKGEQVKFEMLLTPEQRERLKNIL